MIIDATDVNDYIAKIPSERTEAFKRLRKAIQDNIPEGFTEAMSYGMPGYVVPHSIYPAGYHCKPEEPLPFISIASQKHFIAYYHMGLYAVPELLEWFQREWTDRSLGKLDMGKSCIRLRKIDTIPFDLLGELSSKISVEQWIALYEKS